MHFNGTAIVHHYSPGGSTSLGRNMLLIECTVQCILSSVRPSVHASIFSTVLAERNWQDALLAAQSSEGNCLFMPLPLLVAALYIMLSVCVCVRVCICWRFCSISTQTFVIDASWYNELVTFLGQKIESQGQVKVTVSPFTKYAKNTILLFLSTISLVYTDRVSPNLSLVHLGTETNCLGLGVRGSKVKVIRQRHIELSTVCCVLTV